MAREEQIKQAAKNSTNEMILSDMAGTYYQGFHDGANWADNNPKSLWISVEDKLPDVDEHDIYPKSKPVIVKRKIRTWYETKMLVYNKTEHCWDNEYADDYYCDISHTDMWVPVSKLGEE
ncbi:MAG: hypothetical protein EGP82_00090 [Odoribacter splanchnicus]|nr:hypothetical protein [Odoribacter splanchnicus]